MSESLQAEVLVKMRIDVVGDNVELALVLLSPHVSERTPMDR